MKTTRNETKVRRRSGQREAIWNFLKDRTDHPTADVVYAHVRETYPNISLGTVYRNLELLEEMGYVATVDVGDGTTHFDPNCMPHAHFTCTECGCVMDLPSIETASLWKGSDTFPGEVSGVSVLFSGQCKECLSRKKQKV